MKNEYYRVTCYGIGIYEYLKKYLWNNVSNAEGVWNDFIKSNNTNWLSKPIVYNDKTKKCYSYFNIKGYKMFLERTLPLITYYIDKNIIKTEIIKINKDQIVYQDEYQIVVEVD